MDPNSRRTPVRASGAGEEAEEPKPPDEENSESQTVMKVERVPESPPRTVVPTSAQPQQPPPSQAQETQPAPHEAVTPPAAAPQRPESSGAGEERHGGDGGEGGEGGEEGGTGRHKERHRRPDEYRRRRRRHGGRHSLTRVDGDGEEGVRGEQRHRRGHRRGDWEGASHSRRHRTSTAPGTVDCARQRPNATRRRRPKERGGEHPPRQPPPPKRSQDDQYEEAMEDSDDSEGSPQRPPQDRGRGSRPARTRRTSKRGGARAPDGSPPEGGDGAGDADAGAPADADAEPPANAAGEDGPVKHDDARTERRRHGRAAVSRFSKHEDHCPVCSRYQRREGRKRAATPAEVQEQQRKTRRSRTRTPKEDESCCSDEECEECGYMIGRRRGETEYTDTSYDTEDSHVMDTEEETQSRSASPDDAQRSPHRTRQSPHAAPRPAAQTRSTRRRVVATRAHRSTSRGHPRRAAKRKPPYLRSRERFRSLQSRSGKRARIARTSRGGVRTRIQHGMRRRRR